MLTRRQFIIGGSLALLGSGCSVRRLLIAGGGGSVTIPPIDWTITSPSASTLQSNLAASLAANTFSVTVGTVVEQGYRPASVYDGLWVRDNAYVIWHYPTLQSSAIRTQFALYNLANPNGSGQLPDWINATGTITYLTAGGKAIWDGIAFVILALWSDWNVTGDASVFTANQAAIDTALAAVPRSANHCVYSDPATPIVDYGFTDTILKTGDVAYGTALMAWAYKMCAEMAGEGGSGTYSTARANAESGLATLRDASGWYLGSSGNNSGVYDVWATALAVAENLVGGSDQIASATTIRDAYLNGTSTPQGWTSTITQFGLVRHLPVGQFWTGTSTTAGQYQNGGYWPTPVWDCVRAVALVDRATALAWAADVLTQYNDEFTAEADWTHVPYEWHNYTVGVGAKGYAPHAALVNRFV